ncbi:hypothetical protein CE91St43_21910 [Oscillospiraceae bacterium]|nr:hypothetical protein CE91St43_21910 [Oscillospiraceae bacterium]
MKKGKELLLFWLPLIGLTAAGVALWPLVFKARFPEGQALHFVVGPLWGWMGLAQLMGFFPRREDRPPEPLPVRLSLGLAMLGLCALYLGKTFLPALWSSFRPPLLVLQCLFLVCYLVFTCLSSRKKYREE